MCRTCKLPRRHAAQSSIFRKLAAIARGPAGRVSVTGENARNRQPHAQPETGRTRAAPRGDRRRKGRTKVLSSSAFRRFTTVPRDAELTHDTTPPHEREVRHTRARPPPLPLAGRRAPHDATRRTFRLHDSPLKRISNCETAQARGARHARRPAPCPPHGTARAARRFDD